MHLVRNVAAADDDNGVGGDDANIRYELAALHSPFDAGGAPTLYDIFQVPPSNFPGLVSKL